MTEPALQFQDADLIGRVAAVDTSRVLIDVQNASLLTRIGIGNLVAIRGATEREFLIALTERATRSLREALPDPLSPSDEGDPLTITPTD